MRHPNADLVAVCDLYETRTSACMRLFGAKEQYLDYYEMIARADIEAVWILTAPGTHVAFTMAAVEAGKHVLIQKPMATDMEDARAIAAAVRQAGVKALIEPSSNSPLDADYTCASWSDRACWATPFGSRWAAPAPRATRRGWAAILTARPPFTLRTAAAFCSTCPTRPTRSWPCSAPV